MSTAKRFPFPLLQEAYFPGHIGRVIDRLEGISLVPPYPWGHWLYAQVYQKHCAGKSGDIAEFGVAKGGMTLFLAELVKLFGDSAKVKALDTYLGIPDKASFHDNNYFIKGDYASNEGSLVACMQEKVKSAGLGDTIEIVVGKFSDTGKQLNKPLKFVHVDADLYDSVSTALEVSYDLLIDGGILVIDDFFHHAQGPARALKDFMNRRGLQQKLHVVFPYSVFIIKGENLDNQHPCPPALDGNVYSFAWLKNDSLFNGTLDEYINGSDVRSDDFMRARLLKSVLENESYDSVDIQNYIVSLKNFWDACAPIEGREPITLSTNYYH